MNEVYKYLISLGSTSKKLHGLKPHDKIKLIAKSFGYTKVPKLSKDLAKEFLNKFIELENKDKEAFTSLFMPIAQLHLNKYLPKDTLDEHTLTTANLPSKKFYISKEWRDLRYKVLHHHGNRCRACGRSPKNGVVIHVDHILPRSIYPEHALSFSNLQVLCEDCNIAKSNIYETDWR